MKNRQYPIIIGMNPPTKQGIDSMIKLLEDLKKLWDKEERQ